MKEYLIGTGGWAYFRIPRLDPLAAYSRVFNFVEVNSSFYEMPALRDAEKWRERVPKDFLFTLRAHKSITHIHRMRPVEQVLEALEQMNRICRVLHADILHLLTPPSLKLDTFAQDLNNTLSSVKIGNLRFALEPRQRCSTQLPPELLRTMQDHNMIHAVDLSKGESPAFESDVLYTRLFGRGRHNIYQPTDGELIEIDRKASNSRSERVIMSFHFVRMYKDAARLKTYRQTGEFPSITKSTGMASLKEVLSEDTFFPSTKQALVRSQGWKLFDFSEKERIHTSELLRKLPEGTYDSLGEVTAVLSRMER